MAGSLGNVLITVTHLHICPKTGNVKAYLSFMPSQSGYQMIQEIEKNTTKIRGLLGKQLATKIRRIPNIKFCLDNSIERAFHLEKLLNGFHVSATHMDVQPRSSGPFRIGSHRFMINARMPSIFLLVQESLFLIFLPSHYGLFTTCCFPKWGHGITKEFYGRYIMDLVYHTSKKRLRFTVSLVSSHRCLMHDR
eukprot:gene280-365_t